MFVKLTSSIINIILQYISEIYCILLIYEKWFYFSYILISYIFDKKYSILPK